jgi:hypothetical protein
VLNLFSLTILFTFACSLANAGQVVRTYTYSSSSSSSSSSVSESVAAVGAVVGILGDVLNTLPQATIELPNIPQPSVPFPSPPTAPSPPPRASLRPQDPRPQDDRAASCARMARLYKTSHSKMVTATQRLDDVNDSHPDKLCDFGRNVGLPLLQENVNTVSAARGERCFGEADLKRLSAFRKLLEDEKSSVASDCKRAVQGDIASIAPSQSTGRPEPSQIAPASHPAPTVPHVVQNTPDMSPESTVHSSHPAPTLPSIKPTEQRQARATPDPAQEASAPKKLAAKDVNSNGAPVPAPSPTPAPPTLVVQGMQTNEQNSNGGSNFNVPTPCQDLIGVNGCQNSGASPTVQAQINQAQAAMQQANQIRQIDPSYDGKRQMVENLFKAAAAFQAAGDLAQAAEAAEQAQPLVDELRHDKASNAGPPFAPADFWIGTQYAEYCANANSVERGSAYYGSVCYANNRDRESLSKEEKQVLCAQRLAIFKPHSPNDAWLADQMAMHPLNCNLDGSPMTLRQALQWRKIHPL